MLKPEILQFGEKGLLLTWPENIDDLILQSVLAYQKWIEKNHNQFIQETNIGYQSLFILLNGESETRNLASILEGLILKVDQQIETKKFIYTIPVCYDLSFGLDLENLAAEKQLNIDEVIEMHINKCYKVNFIGFLPGFLYLSGLNPALYSSRLTKPRLDIPKGSVGIGGEQTGVYPQNSPGGWKIIGRTPILLFDKTKKSPALCEPGNFLKFESVSLKVFNLIEEQIKINKYVLKREVKND